MPARRTPTWDDLALVRLPRHEWRRLQRRAEGVYRRAVAMRPRPGPARAAARAARRLPPSIRPTARGVVVAAVLVYLIFGLRAAEAGHAHWGMPWLSAAAMALFAVIFPILVLVLVRQSLAVHACRARLVGRERVRPVRAAREPPAASAAPLPLDRVLRHRRAFWLEHVDRSASMNHANRLFDSDPLALPVFIVVMIGIFVFAYLPEFGSPFIGRTTLCAMPVLLLAGVLFFPVNARHLAWRMLEHAKGALTEQTCPDCRYPLADLPKTAEAGGPGPARCPECASPWPLVPPPASSFSEADLPAATGPAG